MDLQEAKAWAATAALNEFRGTGAIWYRYLRGPKAFTLLVGCRSGAGSLLLHFEGCRTIASPIRWILQEPVIRWLGAAEGANSSEGGYEMRDDPAGFRVSAMTLEWARDNGAVGYDAAAVDIERAERARLIYGLTKKSGQYRRP